MPVDYQILMTPDLRRQLRVTGIVLTLIGLVGVLAPQLVSVTLSLLIAVLLIAAGVLFGWLAWQGYQRSGMGWLKAFALVVAGLLIAFNPIAGAAALVLLLIVYFLFDAFASIGLALQWRPLPGWGWLMVNGLLSALLAVLLIGGWPFQADWILGLIVGISLLFDGLVLLVLSWVAREV